ncbi:MAG: O-antigen ligase family protein [Acidobacteria bacterium]|nr:O-antigen ligase family protein [Acidobacteriota bacterium]
MTAFFERTLLVILLFAVVFSALAQGVVEAWSVAVFEALGILSLLGLAAKLIAQKSLTLKLPPLALPVLALLLVGLVQGLAVSDSVGEMHSLSRNVEATRRAVLMLFCLTVFLLVAINLLVSRTRLYGVVNFLVGYGVALAMFSLVQFFTWNGRFYWFKPNLNGASPFGPFVSHNHFSGYMEMLIPLALALAWAEGRKLEARLFYGFAALVMSTAAVASLSRGGMVSLAAAIAFMGFCKIMLRMKRRARRHAPLTLQPRAVTWIKGLALSVAILLALGLGVLWVGPDRLVGRLTGGAVLGATNQEETFYTSRGWIWKDTWAMIKANPVLGVGLGGFATAYPQYSHSDGALIVGQAHNDYLQVLADAGLTGGLLALWFLALIFRELLRGLKARDPLLAALTLGSGAGVFAILVHSLFDFNLQLPSNTLLFFLLVALLSQTVEQVRRYEDTSTNSSAGQTLFAALGVGKALMRETR